MWPIKLLLQKKLLLIGSQVDMKEIRLETIQRKAYSGGKEDKIEVCKILEQKDEVDKLFTSWIRVKSTELDYL